MDTIKRSILLIILAFIGGITLFYIDFLEHGLSVGIFGWPVLVFGIIGVPSLIDYYKCRKE